MNRLFLVMAFSVLGLSACSSAGDSPEVMVDQMYSELLAGNTDGVAELWSNDLKAQLGEQQADFFATMGEVGAKMNSDKFSSLEIKEVEIDENTGSRAQVFVSEHYENEREMYGFVTLIQEDGGWKIDGWLINQHRPDSFGMACINWPDCY